MKKTNSKSVEFLCHTPDTVSVAAERKGFTKTWITIMATAALTVGMFFVQSCSNSAKAGPNGGDVVVLNDGKTSAEVLANADTGEVMVNTWDNDLKSARPVAARPLTMGADANQIQLEPHPLASDPPGYCSRFYGRADWLRGGTVHHGWLSNSGAETGRQNFEWNHGWQAGKNYGGMWSEMGGHGPGMGQGGPGGMHH